jgi:RecA/RadA recombinase
MDDTKMTHEEMLMAGGVGLMQVTNCFEMAQKVEYKLGTGCKVINDYLRGGFLAKKIYEVYGESGTGKTQFAI